MYTCVDTVDTMDPSATPMTDPVKPMIDEKNIEVRAARAVAAIWTGDIPVKMPFRSGSGCFSMSGDASAKT
ncbi:hypothetical protein [uncultured Slackia sp.]|uniref:hypothetical protein n=1 Tax=uncultured Slackia sp. TaxID=665903 RepID=UPI00280596C5|nr:hypothetical protein [uncultured Slackia sp.]